MGLNSIVCLQWCDDPDCLYSSTYSPWGVTVPGWRTQCHQLMSFRPYRTASQSSRPMCLWLQASLVVHMGNLLMSVGVFGPGPVKISISLNASRAAWQLVTEDGHETANSLRRLHEQTQGSRHGFIKLMHWSTSGQHALFFFFSTLSSGLCFYWPVWS